MSQKCSTYIVETHPDGTLESYECCCRGFESRFERTVNSYHHLLVELWPGSSSSYRSMSATSARQGFIVFSSQARIQVYYIFSDHVSRTKIVRLLRLENQLRSLISFGIVSGNSRC